MQPGALSPVTIITTDKVQLASAVIETENDTNTEVHMDYGGFQNPSWNINV